MDKSSMRILISIGHPAQVHQFKYLYKEMRSRGHDLLFLAKDKEMTHYLLDTYGIPYISVRKTNNGLMNKICNIPYSCYQALKILLKFKPTIILSRGYLPVVWVGYLLRIKHIYFTDTEHVNLADKLTIPFVNCKITSTSYNKNLGRNHIKYHGLIELFYMHPRYFSAKTKENNTRKKILLRFIAWNAYHDFGQEGLSGIFKKQLIDTLSEYGDVLISSEGKLPIEMEEYRVKVNPEDMHTLMSEVDLFIGEGASMASECACIGTPAIYVNPLEAGSLDELTENGLIYQFRNSEGVIDKAVELLELKDLSQQWKKKELVSSKMH